MNNESIAEGGSSLSGGGDYFDRPSSYAASPDARAAWMDGAGLGEGASASV